MISIIPEKTKTLTEMQKIIRERQKKMQEWRTPLGMIATQMYRAVMENFRRQGTEDEPWKPLSPVTIKMRRKGKGRGSPRILQDTGTLMGSIIPTYDERRALVGTTLNYAIKHQFGVGARTETVPAYTRKDGVRVSAHTKRMPPIPARPFLVLGNEAKNKIYKIARRVIEGKI